MGVDLLFIKSLFWVAKIVKLISTAVIGMIGFLGVLKLVKTSLIAYYKVSFHWVLLGIDFKLQ